MIGAANRAVCKPFKNSHEEQIRLVSSFDWLDLTALDGIEEEWRELTKDSLFVDEVLTQALCRALRSRIKGLGEIAKRGCQGGYEAEDRRNDVGEDAACRGGDKVPEWEG